jgi:DNA-binding winged helix-turn-helix (wHTH) protein
MTSPQPTRRYRFGVFEADATLGELRRQGVRIKLNAQPFQVLVMLLERPGELLTREEISRQLWPDGTFVDYEHGMNSAVNRIREALGDTAGNPRFIETLARKGYRFVAPVEQIVLKENPSTPESRPEAESKPEPSTLSNQTSATAEPSATAKPSATAEPEAGFLNRILASPEELPKTSYPVVRTLFVLLQIMYLSFYVGALANLAEIEDLFSALSKATQILTVLIVTAAIMIPVRAFILSMILFHAPGARGKFLKIWPFLLLLDELWALSPLLLLHHISVGLALSCTALLVYSPFAQRALILMGATEADRQIPTTARGT